MILKTLPLTGAWIRTSVISLLCLGLIIHFEVLQIALDYYHAGTPLPLAADPVTPGQPIRHPDAAHTGTDHFPVAHLDVVPAAAAAHADSGSYAQGTTSRVRMCNVKVPA